MMVLACSIEDRYRLRGVADPDRTRQRRRCRCHSAKAKPKTPYRYDLSRQLIHRIAMNVHKDPSAPETARRSRSAVIAVISFDFAFSSQAAISSKASHDEKEHFRQRMGDSLGLARILYRREMLQQAANARFRVEIVHPRRPELESPMESHIMQSLNGR